MAIRSSETVPGRTARAAALLLPLLVACGAGEDGSAPAEASEAGPAAEPEAPSAPNLIPDPSTEAGRAAWSEPEGEAPAVRGFEWTEPEDGGAPHLRLHLVGSEHGEREFGVYGPSFGKRAAVLELGADTPVPAVLRARYRLNEWRRHTPKQYFQVAVVADRPGNSTLRRDSSMELGAIVFGLREAPVQSENRLFAYTGPVEPVVGEWVDLELPLRELFQEKWHLVPREYERLRVVLEARFDSLVDLRVGDAVIDLEVTDLYLGADSNRGNE